MKRDEFIVECSKDIVAAYSVDLGLGAINDAELRVIVDIAKSLAKVLEEDSEVTPWG